MANNFSFDDGEFSAQDDAADEALAKLNERPPDALPSEEDLELADVDTRLETADYYRALLGHDFFDTESPAAQIVDREMRSFIRERLEILLGLRQPRQADVAQFEDDEVQALKLLAAKVMKKPMLVEGAPAVRKMSAPVPSQKPSIKPRQKPQLSRLVAPTTKPTTKPRAKPAAAPAAPSARAVPTPAPGAETQTIRKADGAMETLVDGALLTEGNRSYRVVRNEAGTLYKKDVSGQAVPTGYRPPVMSAEEFSRRSEQMANEQIARLDDTTGMAIVASLRP